MSSNHRTELYWFWAKLGQATWPQAYHPVVCHLIDVGMVAAELWESCIRDKVKERIATQLSLCVKDAGAWIAFWIAAHDIGKITPCFQQQGASGDLISRLKLLGYDFTLANQHHTETGTFILERLLVAGQETSWHQIPKSLAHKIAITIGGHHGTFPLNANQAKAATGNDAWANARVVLMKLLANIFGINALPAPKLLATDDQSIWMVLAGLTSVADWIGSNGTVFEFAGNPEMIEEPINADSYATNARIEAKHALQLFGWLHPDQPVQHHRSFQEVTGLNGQPRPLQNVVAKLADEMTTPQLIIVEAPMGEGKTEAAWYVADCWNRMGGAGTYVALPTMATSNQMFDRVARFLTQLSGTHNLQLLHGKASLNPNFDRLKYQARLYDSDDKSNSANGVIAEEWFAKNKKQALLAPFGVGTIDQVLMAVLQTKHVFVRLFGLAGKCVILDEVHAYDAYMTTLMERLLRWLAAMGCPVVLLSATLPKERRLKLLSAYAGETPVEIPEEKPYPRVTKIEVGGKSAEEIAVTADVSREKSIALGWLAPNELAQKLRESLQNGGCAAVIRNTVGLAQETYLSLRDELEPDGIEVELFHARFPFGRRQEIETEVLSKYGKCKDGNPENTDRPKKSVLVATQVIEQSLDLDFDLMISDLAPVDLVLQRAGRLHRHPRAARPTSVAQPMLWLIQPEEKDNRPDFGASEWVYRRYVLLKSWVALKLRATVELPALLEPLVEQVYGTRPMALPDEHTQDLEDSKKAMDQAIRDSRLNAIGVSIYAPDEDPLHQQSAFLLEDSPEAHRKVQAATRETELTIQLILVYRLHGTDYLDPLGQEPFDPSRQPTIAELRRLLQNEVSIANKSVVFEYLGQPVPEGWKKCGMLQYHRVATLDENGIAQSGDCEIKYDPELGVTIN